MTLKPIQSFAAALLIGELSRQRLAVDLLPSIAYPRLTVLTVYEDIPAEDLERLGRSVDMTS
mgnify:CR=1 FL=1